MTRTRGGGCWVAGGMDNQEIWIWIQELIAGRDKTRQMPAACITTDTPAFATTNLEFGLIRLSLSEFLIWHERNGLSQPLGEWGNRGGLWWTMRQVSWKTFRTARIRRDSVGNWGCAELFLHQSQLLDICCICSVLRSIYGDDAVRPRIKSTPDGSTSATSEKYIRFEVTMRYAFTPLW